MNSFETFLMTVLLKSSAYKNERLSVNQNLIWHYSFYSSAAHDSQELMSSNEIIRIYGFGSFL